MNLKFRQANREDLPKIVRMLADDFLGKQRERFANPLPESYVKAFEEIEADKNNELIVAKNDGEIVGTLQITFTPSISFQGGKRVFSARRIWKLNDGFEFRCFAYCFRSDCRLEIRRIGI